MVGGFDFEGFARAFTSGSAKEWLAFYADDAEWIEYKPWLSTREPRVMRGREEILPFLERVREAGVEINVSDEVVGPERAAFCFWVTLPDGRRIIEHAIVHHRDGKVVRQVEVEAWDPEDDDAG